jgi:hypothetical protein
MKNKLIVGYSTNKDERFQRNYNREIVVSSGLSVSKGEIKMVPYFNDGSKSLTEVYNEIWEYHYDKYAVMIFIHHDISFKTKGWGKNVINIFNNFDIDILGVAGTERLLPYSGWWMNEQKQMDRDHLWGIVWHDIKGKTFPSVFTPHHKKCEKVQPVVMVDGLFIAFDPYTCQPFDEEFTGFHHYDSSFCAKNIIAGQKIGVTQTISIVHQSGGNLTKEWYDGLALLYEKYLKKAGGTLNVKL